MKLTVVLGIVGLFVSNHVLAQNSPTIRVTEASVCTSQQPIDCKKINVTNLVVHNLFSFAPVKIEFNVDGESVVLPLQLGKDSTKCAVGSLKPYSNQSVIRQDGYYYSKNNITWQEEPFDAVHENVDFTVRQYPWDNKVKLDVDYTHDTWCPTISEMHETIVYRIRGTFN